MAENCESREDVAVDSEAKDYAFDIETIHDCKGLDKKHYQYLCERLKIDQNKSNTNEITKDDICRAKPFVFLSRVISASFTEIKQDDSLGKTTVIYLGNADNAEQPPHTLKVGDKENSKEYSVEYQQIGLKSKDPQDIQEKEKQLVEEAVKILLKANKVYTYNGSNFDMPVMRFRAMYYGLDFPNNLMTNRFKNNPKHIDLMTFLSDGNFNNQVSFSLICDIFGIGNPKEELSGDAIYDAFSRNQFFEIAKYNAKDTIALGEFYFKCKQYINQPSNYTAPTEKQIQYLDSLLQKLPKNDVKALEQKVKDKRIDVSSLIDILKVL